LKDNRIAQLVQRDFPADCQLTEIDLEGNRLAYIPNGAFFRCRNTLSVKL